MQPVPAAAADSCFSTMLAAGRLAQEPRASCVLGPASSLAEAGGFRAGDPCHCLGLGPPSHPGSQEL